MATLAGGDLKPGDPLLIWDEALRDISQQKKIMVELNAQQDDLLAQLQSNLPLIRTGTASLGDISYRKERRQLVTQMHDNQKKIDEAEKTVREAAKRVVDNAKPIKERLASVKGDLEKAGGAKDEKAQRRATRIQRGMDLMDEVQVDPQRGEDRVIGLMLMISRSDGPGMDKPIFYQIQEQFDRLERRQKFLRERMEAQGKEMREIREQLDQMRGATETAATTQTVAAAPMSVPAEKEKKPGKRKGHAEREEHDDMKRQNPE